MAAGTWSSVELRKHGLLTSSGAILLLNTTCLKHWYSFRILPDRLQLIRLYPCGTGSNWYGCILVGQAPTDTAVSLWDRLQLIRLYPCGTGSNWYGCILVGQAPTDTAVSLWDRLQLLTHGCNPCGTGSNWHGCILVGQAPTDTAVSLWDRLQLIRLYPCGTGSNWHGCILVGQAPTDTAVSLWDRLQTDTAVSLWDRLQLTRHAVSLWDRLQLTRLYPCGTLGSSISFILAAWAGRFTATPRSDVLRICAHDYGVMATLSVRQKMFVCFLFCFSRASQFPSDHNFTYIIVLSELEQKLCQKSPQTFDLSFNGHRSN